MSKKRVAKKSILSVTFNEKEEKFYVELGKDITDEDVFVSLVFAVETLAEKIGITADSAWNRLAIYHKGRTGKNEV